MLVFVATVKILVKAKIALINGFFYLAPVGLDS